MTAIDRGIDRTAASIPRRLRRRSTISTRTSRRVASPTVRPEPPPPATDQIMLTVTDYSAGLLDTVHFIFNEAGDTSEWRHPARHQRQGRHLRDGHQRHVDRRRRQGSVRVRAGLHRETIRRTHTITDFATGLDKIDLRQFSDISSIGNLTSPIAIPATRWSPGSSRSPMRRERRSPEHELLLLKNVSRQPQGQRFHLPYHLISTGPCLRPPPGLTAAKNPYSSASREWPIAHRALHDRRARRGAGLQEVRLK